MAHPFISLLREPKVRTLWLSVSLSSLCDEIYRIAIVWIAIEIAGVKASYVATVQYAALLAVSVFAGVVAERFSPQAVMVGTNILRAILSAAPVALWAIAGLTLTTLLAFALALSSARAFFDPALLSSLPRLAGQAERLRPVNALFDATARLGRFVAPSFVAAASLFVAPVHLLTVNSVGQLLSAYTLSRFGVIPQATAEHADRSGSATLSWALFGGLSLAYSNRLVCMALAAHAVVLALWTLSITLALPMLMAQSPPSGFETKRFAALGLILACYGVGDLISNLIIASCMVRNNERSMYFGYIVLGLGICLLPVPLMLPVGEAQLLLMMAIAFVGASGSPLFVLTMMTAFQNIFEGAALRSILRLRLASVALSIMIATAFGPLLFDSVGASATIVVCGVAIMIVGVAGMLVGANRFALRVPTSLA